MNWCKSLFSITFRERMGVFKDSGSKDESKFDRMETKKISSIKILKVKILKWKNIKNKKIYKTKRKMLNLFLMKNLVFGIESSQLIIEIIKTLSFLLNSNVCDHLHQLLTNFIESIDN